MATIQKIEDLEIWQISREYAKQIKQLTQTEPYKFEFDLVSQMKRASGSIMDNIAEGFGRGSKNEFINFLTIAKGSAEESKSQLYRSLDYGLITETVFQELYQLVQVIIKKTTSFINYLNKSLIKGTKFKDRG
ncbi:MAG: four helix bundle protein [Chitinophagaceae bacterium]|nr:four helix bundle protein [Chitinophagaceae bacterium]MCW5904923.1 four helix bundle protein [Chitinophagaceae bacterium]